MNACGIIAQQLASAVDNIGCGRVERGNLVQNQLLVGHRLRHSHSRAKRANGSRRRPVHTLYQFDIVLFHQIKRQITLHRNSHLRQQVLRALPYIKQCAFLDRAGLCRVGQFELCGFLLQLRIELLRHDNHLFKFTHGNPKVLPLHINRGIVHQQLVLAIAKPAED